VIPARRTFGPLAGPPAKRVTVPEGDRYTVRVTLTPDDAERRARERVQEGLQRPRDIHTADIEAARLVWIPLWRIDAEIDGRHLGLRALSDAKGRLRGVLPTGGEVHHHEVGAVLARSLLPVDPSTTVTLDAHDLLPWANHPPRDGEVVEPDVARDEAEHTVATRLRRRVIPGRALYADVEVRVRSAAMVFLPVWLRRYRYEGEAARAGGEECHVALHAGTGAVVSERHPAGWRAVAGRLRGLFRR
jgi:hypothetical protein